MSAYVIGKGPGAEKLSGLVPLLYDLKADWGEVVVDVLGDGEDVGAIHTTMNLEVASGTYPQSETMDRKAFDAYYRSHVVLVARRNQEIVGSMYIKPNFPGRCGHICNGGLLVVPEWRGRGVGKALAQAFERCAPALGYRAAFFNLVFEDNPASMSLWQSMGYKRVGTVPESKLSQDGETYIDAAMLHKKFV